MKKKIMIILCTVLLLLSFIIHCFAIEDNSWINNGFSPIKYYNGKLNNNDLVIEFHIILNSTGKVKYINRFIINDYFKTFNNTTNGIININYQNYICSITVNNTANTNLKMIQYAYTVDDNFTTINFNTKIEYSANTSNLTNNINYFNLNSSYTLSTVVTNSPDKVTTNLNKSICELPITTSINNISTSVDTTSTNDIITKILYVTIFFGLLAFAMNFIHRRSLNM